VGAALTVNESKLRGGRGRVQRQAYLSTVLHHPQALGEGLYVNQLRSLCQPVKVFTSTNGTSPSPMFVRVGRAQAVRDSGVALGDGEVQRSAAEVPSPPSLRGHTD
jgi:hypothetical protein